MTHTIALIRIARLAGLIRGRAAGSGLRQPGSRPTLGMDDHEREARMTGATEPLTGQILDEDAVTPRSHDVTPGWVGRNRVALDRARAVTRALMIVAPPPIRVPLALASLAADAAFLAEDARRRLDDPGTAGLRGVAVVLEGAALLAASRYAPARLAANIGAIEMARGVTVRLLSRRPRP